MTDYYTPEAVDKLIGEISSAEDSIKYLLNIPLSNEKSKLRTPEMMEAYSDLAAACADLARTYEFYFKAENYLCQTEEDIFQNIVKNLSKKPSEAL